MLRIQKFMERWSVMILFRLNKFFKESYLFQYLILVLSILCCVLYAYFFLGDIGGYLNVIQTNTALVKTDTELQEVSEYEMSKDGKVSYNLLRI